MERKPKHFRKREAILSCLRHTDTHPTAEWIYESLKGEYPDLSLGTVYRNLSLFKEQGIITSLGTVNGVERFDGTTAPHVHYICATCGTVLDLLDLRIPKELRSAAAEAAGGSVSHCQLSFTGQCRNCQNLIQEEIS